MVLESLTDVTDQRRAEATLHESQKRLQELQAELLHASRLSVMGQMLAALAHELNQPLTAVAAYLQACQQMLENSAPPPPDLVEALELASEQVERSGQIIHRLRSFLSRNAAEKRPEPVVNLLKEAVALAQTGSKEIPVTLEFRSPSNTSWVLADRVQIQQVLLNLIRNAIEAMAGLEKRQISITAEPQGEMVCFGVADAGTGISAKIEPQLFQPFVTTKKNGMGLGLSICRTIVEEHGGRIWAQPNPGGGTVFRFTLPAASQPDITYG
jgi:two-component system sensor kinase FixL